MKKEFSHTQQEVIKYLKILSEYEGLNELIHESLNRMTNVCVGYENQCDLLDNITSKRVINKKTALTIKKYFTVTGISNDVNIFFKRVLSISVNIEICGTVLEDLQELINVCVRIVNRS